MYGSIVKCRNCGFIFTNPQFDHGEYDNIYKNVPAGDSNGKKSEKRFQLLRDKILTYCTTGKLFELGCHDGLFMKIMGGRFNSTGIDIGEFAKREPTGINNILYGDFIETVNADKNLWKIILIW